MEIVNGNNGMAFDDKQYQKFTIFRILKFFESQSAREPMCQTNIQKRLNTKPECQRAKQIYK